MREEGYIKFNCHLTETGPVIPVPEYEIVNRWRSRMHELSLIGIYENGIGYGNISIRVRETMNFYITGSATGRFRHASREHYVMVTGYDFEKNSVQCRGPVRASSESLSHAAIYEANKKISAVIHVHHRKMWERGLKEMPATNPEFGFGTPEIAKNIIELLQDQINYKKGIIIMGGHPEGILFFGKNMDETGDRVTGYLNATGND